MNIDYQKNFAKGYDAGSNQSASRRFQYYTDDVKFVGNVPQPMNGKFWLEIRLRRYMYEMSQKNI